MGDQTNKKQIFTTPCDNNDICTPFFITDTSFSNEPYPAYGGDLGVCVPTIEQRAQCVNDGIKSAYKCICAVNKGAVFPGLEDCRTNLGIIDIYIWNRTNDFTFQLGNVSTLKIIIDTPSTKQSEDSRGYFLEGFDAETNKIINPGEQVWWRGLGFCGAYCGEKNSVMQVKIVYDIFKGGEKDKIGELIICAQRSLVGINIQEDTTCQFKISLSVLPVAPETGAHLYSDVEECPGTPFARIEPPTTNVKVTPQVKSGTSWLHITLDPGLTPPENCSINKNICGPGERCNIEGKCVPISGPNGNGNSSGEIQKALIISITIVVAIILFFVLILYAASKRS